MDKQLTMSFLIDEPAEVRTHKKEFPDRIDRLVPWGEWVKKIQPHYYKGEHGNKPHDLELMLRIYVLQNLYNLSDMAVKRVAKNAEVVRIFSGSGETAARLSEQHHYLKEEPDMKAKPGFVVRNIADEFILMPKGENIGKFNGAILLNEVSAFVWEKLQNPISKEDLLNAILDEYKVDRDVAAKDLGNLLETLRGFDVIVDD